MYPENQYSPESNPSQNDCPPVYPLVPPKKTSPKSLMIAVSFCVIVAAVIAGGFFYTSYHSSTQVRAITPASSASQDYFPVGDPHKNTVDVMEDPQCPVCAAYEQTVGAADLVKAALENKIYIKYRMLNFLDRGSISGDYSTRAGAAFLAIVHSNLNPESKTRLWLDFHQELFKPTVQPAEKGSNNGQGNLTNDDLANKVITIAKADSIDVNDTVISDIRDGKYIDEAKKNAAANLEVMKTNKADGTPSIIYLHKVYSLGSDGPNGHASDIGDPQFVVFVIRNIG